VLEAITKNDSVILFISEEVWCLNVYLKTKGKTALIKIYHKKKGFISEIFPKSTLGLEDEILDKVCMTLQDIIT